MIATPLPPNASSPFFVPLVVCGVILGNVGFNFLLSHARGWSRLAERYRLDGPPSGGIKFRTTDDSLIPWMNSEQGIYATLTAHGIYLTARFMRRPFHPPLMLPWPCFESMTVESDLFTQVITLRFADPEERRIKFSLPKKAIPMIRALSGRNDFSGEALR